MPTRTIPGFRGEIITPDHPAYDTRRRVWNAMHDRRPALIARCVDAADVVAAIAYARTHDLAIAVRGGGHSLPGFSVCDDGIVIDLRPMAAVSVDPVARRAVVGGGALLGDVDRATQRHGLAVPAGVISHTGVGGLTLGGGVGRLMRRFGLTVDSLLAAEVVTADGRVLRAAAEENPDLFWAIRGGGGNFGVVTRFEFALHEVSVLPILATCHDLADASEVLRRAQRKMSSGAPDELLWTSFVRKAPPHPWLPEAMVGRPSLLSLIEWSGEPDAGMALLADLRDELPQAPSTLDLVEFGDIQTAGDEVFGPGLLSYIKATFADTLTDGLIDVLVERGRLLRSDLSQIEVLAMGGAIRRVPARATAFAHRDASWLINVPASWRDPADSVRETSWVRDTFAALRPHTAGGAYVNFMDDDERASHDRAYGPTLRRLRAVKAVYDPDNVFRCNQNIEPAAGDATQDPADGDLTDGDLTDGYLTEEGRAQQRLWGGDPDGWAAYSEPNNRPLFEAVLDAAGITGTDRSAPVDSGAGAAMNGGDTARSVLDVGCGAGLALLLARERGGVVSGVDVTPGLLAVARRRLPGADLRHADMVRLPFPDDSFDAVLGVNAFQFAGDPRVALAEAARVCRPGGRVVVGMFAEPSRCESTAIHLALASVSPPQRQGLHEPYALSAPGNLEAALDEVGLRRTGEGEVVCFWRYDCLEHATRALLSSAGAGRAIQDAGLDRARGVIESALAPFVDAASSAVSMRNVFRWVSSTKDV